MLKKNLALAIITTLVILMPILVGLIMWDSLPAEMPIHWNANGEVDGYAAKELAVFGMPLLLAAIHWICLLVTNADPNSKKLSGKATALVLFICPVLSLVMESITYVEALGHKMQINTILPLVMGIIFVIIGNYMPKVQRNYTIGIKIPWALNSDENWARTHRFAGPVWVIGGGVIAALAFTGSVIPLIAAMAAMVILPIAYSYAYYARHERD